MSSYDFAPSPVMQFCDANGVPYASGHVHTYETGGTTPKTTYDKDESANTNPVVLDSAGRATIKLATDAQYRFVLENSAGTTIWTVDGIGANVQSIACVETIAALKAAAEGSAGDVKIVRYYSAEGDGGGGVFTWQAAETENDGGVCVKKTGETDAGAWVRLFNGDVNPRWWGAKGDGTTDDTAAMVLARTYANTHSVGIYLDSGTFNVATTAGTTTTGPVVTFGPKAIWKWSGYALAINPCIPVSDRNRHFNYTVGDDSPTFPTGCLIQRFWLDGSTAGWTTWTFNDIAADDVVVSDRLQTYKGSDVASANNMVLGDGNVFDITGTTTINGISNANWQEGSVVVLQFDGALTLTHNATVVDPYYKLAMLGSTSYTTTVGDVIAFVYCGSIWRQLNIPTGAQQFTHGASTASASSLTLPQAAFCQITGTTDIKYIAYAGWRSGQSIICYSATSYTIHNNEGSVPENYYKILTSSGSDINMAAASANIVMFIYDATNTCFHAAQLV